MREYTFILQSEPRTVSRLHHHQRQFRPKNQNISQILLTTHITPIFLKSNLLYAFGNFEQKSYKCLKSILKSQYIKVNMKMKVIYRCLMIGDAKMKAPANMPSRAAKNNQTGLILPVCFMSVICGVVAVSANHWIVAAITAMASALALLFLAARLGGIQLFRGWLPGGAAFEAQATLTRDDNSIPQEPTLTNASVNKVE